MWVLRVLSGTQKNSFLPLSSGVNTVGRSSGANVQIKSPGVSKNHAEIHVNHDGLLLIDKQSSNGTYVNGIKISKQKVEMGDQISFHDVIVDIVLQNQAVNQNLPAPNPSMALEPHQQGFDSADPASPDDGSPAYPPAPKKPLDWWDNYLEKVILPGVYKLPEWFEFKWVMGLFSLSFILLVTVLSAIPLTRILKSSVEMESMNHAQSIAEALARENKPALMDGLNTAVTVAPALIRPGVKTAYIVNASNGRIIAPAEKYQMYPDNPFIHRARKLDRATVEKIDSSTVAAMVPIQYFNPDTTSQAVMAYSAVFFNLGSLASGVEQTVSLLVQSFFIAVILGALIFFFMYRMTAHPFESLNEQLNLALKDSNVNISSKYQFPALESLCSNINSAIERLSTIQDEMKNPAHAGIDRESEMANLVELVGFAGLCLRLENQTVSAVNQAFEEQTGLSANQILQQPIDQISDTSLKLNLKNAIEKVRENPSQIFIDQLEFNSSPFQVTAQGLHGEQELSYIILAFIPEPEEAA